MKHAFMIMILAALCGCSVAVPITRGSNEKVAANANQHVSIGVMAAVFFCENRKWPESLHELRGFGAFKDISLPVAIDWEWLSRPGVEYTAGEAVILKTPGGTAAGDVAVSSLHSRPGCDGNNINPRVHLNF